MFSSLIIASYLNFFNHSLLSWEKIVIGAFVTTIVWVSATFFTPPETEETLRSFIKKVKPGGPGWGVYSGSENDDG